MTAIFAWCWFRGVVQLFRLGDFYRSISVMTVTRHSSILIPSNFSLLPTQPHYGIYTMDQKAANPKSALEVLPIEVKQAIMSTLPDVWSLKSIALTSSPLYRAFTGAEVLITSRVLLNEVELDVLPEAAAALESSRLKPWTRQRIQDFVFQHLYSRGPPPQKWTLSDALLISKLYDYVHYFAADLASKTLVKPPILTYLKSNQAPLSQNEITRIIRAFYRFEIYCNIFRDPKRTINVRKQRDIFFSNFSPWENEQLACIHDYLFQVVSPGIQLAIVAIMLYC
jgi:hypothetical protein